LTCFWCYTWEFSNINLHTYKFVSIWKRSDIVWGLSLTTLKFLVTPLVYTASPKVSEDPQSKSTSHLSTFIKFQEVLLEKKAVTIQLWHFVNFSQHTLLSDNLAVTLVVELRFKFLSSYMRHYRFRRPNLNRVECKWKVIISLGNILKYRID